MIIQCDKCHAKFKIDDSKVTPQGVKVRCKKCRNIFVVKRPEEEAKGAFEDLRIEELFKEEGVEEKPKPEEGPAEEEREEGFSWTGIEVEARGPEEEKAPPEEEFHFPSGPVEEEEKKELKSPEEAGKATSVEQKESEAREERVEVVKETQEGVAEEKIPSEGLPSSRSKILLIVLLLLLLIVLGLLATGRVTVINQWISGLLGKGSRKVTLPNKEFLGKLKSYYVVNEKEGVIFVVEGVIANPESVELPLQRIRVTILDKDGRPLQERFVLLGKVIPKDKLSQLPRDEIEGRLKRGTKTVPPNSSLPFMAVFYQVPTDLSEFVVEVEG